MQETDDRLPVLDAPQARVLGCLIEKQATTPDVYPLTINAAQQAANQKSAREPVMALSQGQVHHALRQLEDAGLVRQVHASRAERYEHVAGTALRLVPQQLGLLALLLLRGAQTAGELLARGERLVPLADVAEVRHHLERLATRAPALVACVPAGAGRREARFVHLLCGPVDVEAVAAALPASPVAAVSGALEARVAALEAEVAQLRDRLDALSP